MKFRALFSMIMILVAVLMMLAPAQLPAQIEELAEQAEGQAAVQADEARPEQEKSKAEQEEDTGPVTDTADSAVTEELGDRYIRFHMWDGSIVGGEVTTNQIDVETEFGTLQVPIGKITKFYPGLDSIPVLNARINQLVEGLGDKDFDVREQSHRELVSMGIQLRTEIHRFEDGGSAERKKHLQEIKKEIEEMVDQLDEFDEPLDERALIRGDMVVTRDFSIVGKILQNEFRIGSKFGELRVNLGDIKMGDRSFTQKREDIRKSVEVSGTAFFQTTPKSTKIRVNRGDKIQIRASGVVQWTNWSTSSTPDGINNQGQWNGMDCGCLAARIGNTSQYIKLGSKAEFVAKQTGVLYLGVAMRDNYASNNGYRWDGNYDVKIVVTPAGK